MIIYRNVYSVPEFPSQKGSKIPEIFEFFLAKNEVMGNTNNVHIVHTKFRKQLNLKKKKILCLSRTGLNLKNYSSLKDS